MNVKKKLLPILLAAGLMLQSVPTVWAEDTVQPTDTVIINDGDTEEIFPDPEEEVNIDAVPTASEIIENGISLFSMMPLQEKKYETVYIERAQLEDQPKFTFKVSEILYAALQKYGKLNENGEFAGKIAAKTGYGDSYQVVEWNDFVTLDMSTIDDSSYGNVYYKNNVEFILSDDQLNTNVTEYNMKIYYMPPEKAFLNKIDFSLYNNAGNGISVYRSNVNSAYDVDDNDFTVLEFYVSSNSITENDNVNMLIGLPSGSEAVTSVYEGKYSTESEIDASKNITSSIVGSISDKSAYPIQQNPYNSKMWGEYFTFTTVIDSETVVVPVYVIVYLSENEIKISSIGSSVSLNLKDEALPYIQTIYAYKEYADSIDDIEPSITAYYYDYIDSTGSANSRITFACFGKYDSEDDAVAAGAANIKDELFGYGYTDVDTSALYDVTAYDGDQIVPVKAVDVTACDIYGMVHHDTAYFTVIKQEEHMDSPSDDTYFRITGVDYNDGGTDNVKAKFYKPGSSYDSYYLNGYQTVFVLDKNSSVLTNDYIYPVFTTGKNARIYIGNGIAHESETNPLQISGESRIKFKPGEAIQYSAASESGVHLKNYWVTFLTPQQGAKLFVNATNNPDHAGASGLPQREVFITSTNKYHDIMIANIGDEELRGLKVSLSDDTTGVKLDDYWTVVEDSVGTLAPFTTVSSSMIDNIAKIRILPEDADGFAPISGKLTISSANGGSTTIELTGIAGTPKIVTDKMYDGVKYVPYSCVVMTNSMYETDAMKFSIVSGNLPDGLKLMPNGEIYGIPTKTGEFAFTVQAKYTGKLAENGNYTDNRTYTIVIKDNTDENVDAVNTDQQGYELTDRVSANIKVYYNGLSNGMPVIDRMEADSDLLRSIGSYSDEFVNFYIDGVKLAENADYTAREGSTIITVNAQTFGNVSVTDKDTPHTLAAEFRTEHKSKELRRSAQNVYIEFIDISNGKSDNNSGNNGNNGNSGSNGSLGTGGITLSSTEKGSANATVTIVDKNGKPLSGLSLELHSDPIYTTTDSNGYADFGKVELGKHTLYVLDADGKVSAYKKFALVSGKTAGIKGTVVTVDKSGVVNLSIQYDGSELRLLSAQEDVSSMAGISIENEIAWISSYVEKDTTKVFAVLFLAADVVFIAMLIRRKLKS